jgi:ribonuclease-3
LNRNNGLTPGIKKYMGIKPSNPGIYELALVHKSASISLPNGKNGNNERLEYLGDAILDAVIADYLYSAYPDKDEGYLSKLRAKLVKRKHLNSLALKLGVDKMLISRTDNCNTTKHIYGDALEAIIGAVYLDKGYSYTKKYVTRYLIKKHVNLGELEQNDRDYKSKIIEWAQKNDKEISFVTNEAYNGNSKIPHFVSTVKILNDTMGTGIGYSKKEAEQDASKKALLKLEEW